MKSTGIVRKLDDLGRVVIPMEIRRVLALKEKDSIEIFVEEDKIILKKYTVDNACLITGEISNQNSSFADGKIKLSPIGIKSLYLELKAQLEKNQVKC
jgi:AbrB family transcriptional regulator, transcriptional pleiotropic regulator of transition state genes